jgi:tetratricopeptide (TPR) repeat protein
VKNSRLAGNSQKEYFFLAERRPVLDVGLPVEHYEDRHSQEGEAMSDIATEAVDFFNEVLRERKLDLTSVLMWTYTFGPLNEYQADVIRESVRRRGLAGLNKESRDAEPSATEVHFGEVRVHTTDSFAERICWLDELARNNRCELVDWGVGKPSAGSVAPQRTTIGRRVFSAIRRHFVIHLVLLLALAPILIYIAAMYHRRGFDNRIHGRLDQAIADDTEALRFHADARTFNNRGVAYRKKGDLDRAIADYSEAIRLDPHYALAYVNRCRAYMKKRDINQALSDVNMAIVINPQMARAYTSRGHVYLVKGDLDRAIADYDMAIQLEPEVDAEPYRYRAFAYRAKGDFQKADEDFAKARQLPYSP